MKLSLAIISSALLVAVHAANIQFNVIAPSATDVKVSVNGQQVALKASNPSVPYFTGTAETGSATTYKYVVGGTEESFDRSLKGITNSTYNDFINRPVTYANLPQLPWPIENNPQWTRKGPKPEIFDDNYIPTVFFQGDDTQVTNLVKNVPADRVSAVHAANIQFNVIAPNATDVKVSVNGQQVALKASNPSVPYFTGTAETGSATTYKYVVGGTEEGFDRSLKGITNSTYNDFINRPVTYANLPQLPWPIENNPQWTRKGPKPEIFDDNYIPTVFFQGDDAQVTNLVKNVPADRVSGTLTFIGSNYVYTFQNVSFGIHGAGKKHNNAKQSWNWRLSGSDSMGNRNFFKLRHMEEDPTQLRERLYADVLHAMATGNNNNSTSSSKPISSNNSSTTNKDASAQSTSSATRPAVSVAFVAISALAAAVVL
ncbi:hypothetical protein RMCBS344292_00124 [Rhizopus microsporus]|nr:hypothetical protein RMCBS344292_00124 [Rhizopus microsporus]